jgi:outer membrane protein assembly factor BamB
MPLLMMANVHTILAEDWPFWRGATRDGKVHGFVAPATWPDQLTLQWRTCVGAGDATPALVDERVYAFGRLDDAEVIFGLRALDGRELWRHAAPAVRVTGAAAKYGGPRSSLAVAEGKVIALGVGGVLTCLESATGALVWRHEALADRVPRFFTAGSPLVAEGLCVVHLGGQDEGLLVALDMASGRVEWQWHGDGPAYASPALMRVDGVLQVAVQTERNLAGFALRDGRRLWQTATAPRPGYWNSATPVPDGATVVYTGQGTGTYAIRIEAQESTFVVRQLWHQPDLGTVYNTPVLRDGTLFGLSDRGRFFGLDFETGTILWSSSERVSNFGSIVAAGEVLLALPEKSGLVVFVPSRDGYREIARYPVADSPIYAHPVVAGRRVFVRDADSVMLWTLSEGVAAVPPVAAVPGAG